MPWRFRLIELRSGRSSRESLVVRASASIAILLCFDRSNMISTTYAERGETHATSVATVTVTYIPAHCHQDGDVGALCTLGTTHPSICAQSNAA